MPGRMPEWLLNDVVILIGIIISFILLFQFFGGGNTSYGIENHYSSIAHVINNTLSVFIDFIKNNTIRGGFGLGLIIGITPNKKQK